MTANRPPAEAQIVGDPRVTEEIQIDGNRAVWTPLYQEVVTAGSGLVNLLDIGNITLLYTKHMRSVEKGGLISPVPKVSTENRSPAPKQIFRNTISHPKEPLGKEKTCWADCSSLFLSRLLFFWTCRERGRWRLFCVTECFSLLRPRVCSGGRSILYVHPFEQFLARRFSSFILPLPALQKRFLLWFACSTYITLYTAWSQISLHDNPLSILHQIDNISTIEIFSDTTKQISIESKINSMRNNLASNLYEVICRRKWWVEIRRKWSHCRFSGSPASWWVFVSSKTLSMLQKAVSFPECIPLSRP
jgi:hypothetical protein